MLAKCLSGVVGTDTTRSNRGSQIHPGTIYRKVKRVIDVLVVVVVGPSVLLVVAAAAALIIWLDGRPAIFVQERVGRGGRVFRMFKLRTMKIHSSSAVSATERNDPRVTPFGRWLRQSHIDELPQLWNILRGDMTLIGPRPEQPALVAQYREKLPNYDQRHSVTPGLSGWAQVNSGYAADLDETARKLEFDLEYVERCGPAMDLVVMVRTARVFLDSRYVR